MYCNQFVQEGKEKQVCWLKKALCGLKSEPHAWHEKIHVYLTTHAFCNRPSESTLYVRRDSDVLLVNDMLFTMPNEKLIVDFNIELNLAFEISNLGRLHHFWAFNFNIMMMELHCCRQNTSNHYCVVLTLRMISLLLHLWNQVSILVFMMQGSTLM